jgi:predicted cupin superfamily sugar epimerase
MPSDALLVAGGVAAGAAVMYVWMRWRMGLGAQQYVEALGLIAHPEGGFFRETFRSGSVPMSSKGKTDEASADLMESSKPDGSLREGKVRNHLTSIYYCLTTDSPRQWWANNMSDHIHYWHGGGALTYHIVHPDGRYERSVLGPRADRGEVLQLIVRGGSFKCAHLEPGNGEFVLLGEGVAPGFDFRDFAFVSAAELKALVPAERFAALKTFLKEQPEKDFDDYYDKPTTRK